jgi:hypothetical protein
VRLGAVGHHRLDLLSQLLQSQAERYFRDHGPRQLRENVRNPAVGRGIPDVGLPSIGFLTYVVDENYHRQDGLFGLAQTVVLGPLQDRQQFEEDVQFDQAVLEEALLPSAWLRVNPSASLRVNSAAALSPAFDASRGHASTLPPFDARFRRSSVFPLRGMF